MVIAVGRIDKQRIYVDVTFAPDSVFNTAILRLALEQISFPVVPQDTVSYIGMRILICRYAETVIRDCDIVNLRAAEIEG